MRKKNFNDDCLKNIASSVRKPKKLIFRPTYFKVFNFLKMAIIIILQEVGTIKGYILKVHTKFEVNREILCQTG